MEIYSSLKLKPGVVYITKNELSLLWYYFVSMNPNSINWFIHVQVNPKLDEIVAATTFPSFGGKVFIGAYTSDAVKKWYDFKPDPTWLVILMFAEKLKVPKGGTYIELKLPTTKFFSVEPLKSMLKKYTVKEQKQLKEDFKNPWRLYKQLQRKNPLQYYKYEERKYLKEIVLNFLRDYKQINLLIDIPQGELFYRYFPGNAGESAIVKSFKYFSVDLVVFYLYWVERNYQLTRSNPGLSAKAFFTWVMLSSTTWANEKRAGAKIKVSRNGHTYVIFQPSNLAISKL
jgi:hypothetical protein